MLENKKTKYRMRILFVVWLLYVINYFDKFAVLNLLPFIRKDLNVSHEMIGFASSLFFFAYTLAQLPSGMLADKFGPKKVMAVAITVFTFFTFLTGIIKTLPAFIAVRLGLGLGEGFHFVPSVRALSDWFPQKEKGRATSFFTTAWTVAPALAPLLIAGVLTHGTWRTVFFVLAPMGLVGIVLLWWMMKDSPRLALQHGKHISEAEINYIEDGMPIKGAPEKGLLKLIIKDPQLWILTFLVFLKTFVYWGAATWITSFLVEQHGFNIQTMGLMASLPFAVGFLSQMSAGLMLDKLTKQRSKPIILAAFVGLASVLFFVGLIPKGAVPLLVLVLVLQGYFVVLYDGPLYTYVQMRYPAKVVGAATGFTQSIGQFGAFVAPSVSGFLVVTHGSTANYAGVFTLFGIVSIVGAVLTLFLKDGPYQLKPERASGLTAQPQEQRA